jgi:xanthine dehydrogenase/oxidase
MMICEAAVDHLAREMGVTAESLREKNLYAEGEKTHFGTPFERNNLQRCWDGVSKMASLEERREEIAAFNASNRWLKRGLSVIPTKFGIAFTAKFMNQGGALVHIYTDGTVLVSHGGTEMGQGLHTKVIQTVADALEIPVSQVFISETATDKVPNASPSAASLSTDLYAMAALNACREINERLAPVKESMSEEDRGDFLKVISKAYFVDRVDLSAHGFYALEGDRIGYDFDAPEGTDKGRPFNYFTQGCACSEVEVNCLTGDTHIRRLDLVMDVGDSINPAIDIGQIEGAFVQGYGWCALEELIWGDDQHLWVRPGELATRGPGFYKIPGFGDIPEIMNIHLLENAPNPYAVLSSKAIGEPPFFLASSAFFAIKEAIYASFEHESGSRAPFFDLFSPATPERVRMAMKDDITKAVLEQASSEESKEETSVAYQPKGSW